MRFSIALACAIAGAACFGTVEARFGQEQGASQIISQLNGQIQTEPQDSGVISTIAGGSIAPLLAAADPCALADKMDELVEFADKLSDEDKEKVVEAARKAMQSEKNFNPFAQGDAGSKASVCTDPSKPTRPEIRGIIPKVDPSLDGAAEANQKSDEILEGILDGSIDGEAQADGKSIAEQLAEEANFDAIQNLEAGAANDDAANDDAANDDAANDDAANDDAANDDAANDDAANDDAANDDAANDDAANDDAANDDAADDAANDDAGNNNDQILTLIDSVQADLDALRALVEGDAGNNEAANNEAANNAAANNEADNNEADNEAANNGAANNEAANNAADNEADNEAENETANAGGNRNAGAGGAGGAAGGAGAGAGGAGGAAGGAGAGAGAGGAAGENAGAPSAVTPGQTFGDVNDSPIDLGECQEPPAIEFAPGLAGRPATEFTFRPANENTFKGQSVALNPGIIINFLCDRLNDVCKAPDAVAACRTAQQQQQASGDRTGKVADDFNALFGVESNFASIGPNAAN